MAASMPVGACAVKKDNGDMGPQREGKRDKGNDRSDSAAQSSGFQGAGSKSGLLTRFLKWIAKGAVQSRLNGSSCPT